MKKCTECQIYKDESEFYKRGYKCISACKECTKNRTRKYVDKNKEKVLANKRVYFLAHREEKREYDKKWRTENKERKAKNDHEYRLKNLEKCRAASKRRYYERPEYWSKLGKERFGRRFEDETILNQVRTSSKKYHEKNRDELTDVYVARAIWSNLQGEVPIEIIKKNKELIQLKRFEIKFNRNLKRKKNETSEQ